jgi:DNA-binding CsgD family transcriptional regulator
MRIDPGLVGRGRELAQLDALVEQAAVGRSGVLAIVGEPGSGKSALLAALAMRAPGFTVLRASGSELEHGMAFAGIASLLRPVLARLDDLPASQRDSLRSALVLQDGPPIDRFAAYVGVLGVIAAEAERQPLLLIVDDLHWLDPASSEAFLFLARRLEAERVLLVVATRDEKLELIRGLPRFDLAGIDLEKVAELLLERTGVVLAPDVASAVHVRTSGNPLALIEASRTLDEDQRTGRRALPDPIPVGRQLADAYRQRLLALPAATQQALVIAAACDTGAFTVLAIALTAADLQATDLEAAEDAAMLDVRDGRVRFTHPLIRSAAYHSASASDRRRAHRLLAAVSIDPGRQDARAWHLVAAASGPDEAVAKQIEELAFKARARQAPAVASRAFEAAARLTPEPSRGAVRLLEAALDAQQAGLAAAAISLAQQAQASTDDPSIVGQARQLEGRLGFWDGTPGAASVMASAAQLIGEVDPVAGGAALVEAAMLGSFEDMRFGQELAKTPLFASAPPPVRMVFELATSMSTNAWPTARAAMFDLFPSLISIDPLSAPWIPSIYGRGLVVYELWPQGRQLFENVIATARRAGAMSALPIALTSLGEINFRTDRWWHSYAQTGEALRLAEETGGARGFCLATLGLIEAGQGRPEAETHGREALALGATTSNRALRIVAHWALGLWEQGMGRHREALRHFRARDDELTRNGQHSQPIWEIERAETLVRCGLPEEARRIIHTVDALALADQPDHDIRLQRAKGLLASDEDAAAHFEAALTITGESPFERARTQLAYGERLRRTRRRGAATDQLQAALATFTNLGAAGWITQTEREVQAAGGQVARAEHASLSSLTARELQVANAVAAGASNREVAENLFLSEKTVEFHLSKCFQKLAIRSRVELTRLLVVQERSAG